MYQTEFVSGDNLKALKNNLNEFLSKLEAEEIKNISYDFGNMVAAIEYEKTPEWVNSICCDCKYWDDSGNVECVNGLCHEHGGRRRFNCKACKEFKDLRE